MTARTLFEKIWSQHRIEVLGEDAELILIDRILLHERTGGIALAELANAGRSVLAPRQVFCTMDHVVDTFPGRTDVTTMPTGTAFITQTRAAAAAAGLTLFDIGDARQGIVHVISPEQGIVLPGATLVCPDSHTCTQGALGALAWGIGSTEAEHALATGTLRLQRPKTMRVSVTGELSPGVTAKDLALYVTATISASGAQGHVVEYAGEGVSALSVEERLTLCNMATEIGAFTAIIAPDDKVFSYLHGRPYVPQGAAWGAAVAQWRWLFSDPDADFDREITLDAAAVIPMVTWGSSPQQAGAVAGQVPHHEDVARRDAPEDYERALSYMDVRAGQFLADLPIDAAFIGSCTNSRLSDLRAAAALLQGRRVAPHVKAICVPGSSQVKAAAEAEGLDVIFREAGFEWRESGCSMCFFAGGESFGPKARVVSSTNRNFESRQGPETRTHLASPATVAASAIAGRLVDPRDLGDLS